MLPRAGADSMAELRILAGAGRIRALRRIGPIRNQLRYIGDTIDLCVSVSNSPQGAFASVMGGAAQVTHNALRGRRRGLSNDSDGASNGGEDDGELHYGKF